MRVSDDDMERIWSYAGDRGAFSESPSALRSAFDLLVLEKGNRLYYRLRPENERKSRKRRATDTWFDGVILYDPMECFVPSSHAGEFYMTILNPECETMEACDHFPFSIYEDYVAANGTVSLTKLCEREKEATWFWR